MESPNVRLTEVDQPTRDLLVRVAKELVPNREKFKQDWVKTYSDQTRPGQALSALTGKTIPQFVDTFIDRVSSGDFEGYFAGIESLGQEAARLQVPYGDLMMAIHYYEEVTTPALMSAYPQPAQLQPVLISLDRIYHASISLIAAAYLKDIYDQVVRQKNFTETVVNVSPDGILVSDAHRTIIGVNPAMEKLTGYSLEELVGRGCRHTFGACAKDGEYLCDSICPLLAPFSLDGNLEPIEGSLTAKDGRKIWTEVRYGVMTDNTGAITGIVHSFRDITERKETERLRDELMSIASHELRTPITSVKGYAQLLQRRLKKECSDSAQLHSLDIMIGQLDRMAAMVNDLVELSRVQTGHMDLTLEQVDVPALARVIVERLQVTTDKHTITMEDGGAPLVPADSFRVDQVITNLVTNAIRYSPEGGAIRVSAGKQDGYLVLSVADEGVGIAPEDQERIFDQFYQARSEGKAGRQGMGLGLYISKQIIERHGGRIGVESTPGCGSRFYFMLPYIDGTA